MHDAIVTAIAVLIITCPCALALAIPAVQVVASGALFRCGVILNAGDAIERLAEVDTVIFDKTGTLTLPEPRIEEAAPIAPDLLERAARLALSSHHPLAAALAREAPERLPYADAVEEPGRGVRVIIDGSEARLGSRDVLRLGGARCRSGRQPAEPFGDRIRAWRPQAIFEFRQTMRPDAAMIVAALRALGLDVLILSGDRAGAVAPVAAALGTAELDAPSSSRPARSRRSNALKQQGRRVLMVGDGLNDAPALAAAHVSMSPISAADITQAQADAVFLGERLLPVLEAIAIARARAKPADAAEPRGSP